MAIATTTTTTFPKPTRSTDKGVFRRALDRLIAAREHQARRYVNGFLFSLDDATLAAYGYDRAELERQRSTVTYF